MGLLSGAIKAGANRRAARKENKYAKKAATLAWERNQEGATTAYKRSVASVLQNQNFQRTMSSSAHQREVKDLRAAGLNPILSAGGGSGSSTPSGATAQSTAPSAQTSKVASMSHFSNAIDALTQKSQIANTRAQTQLIGENARSVAYTNERKEFFARLWREGNKAVTTAKDVADDITKKWNLHQDSGKARRFQVEPKSQHYKNWTPEQKKRFSK